MKNTKLKLANASRHVFLGSIMKKSANYLPLTNREKAMAKWFIKFQATMILAVISWVIPFQATQSHLSEYKALEAKVSTPEALASPQAKSEEKPLFQLLDEFTGTVYAYNSFESQTDGDPCTGAFGYICDKTNVVANNCYKKGTIVEIEGEKYTVFDRMNKRYGCDVFDIYMGIDHEAAKNWGKKITNVKILRVAK